MGGGGNQTISTSSPVISGMRLQTSSYGLPIPIVWGQTRISANLLWYGDYAAIPHTTTTSSGGGGGKGGGGGVTQQNTTYTYQAAVVMGLCEGPGVGVARVWAGKSNSSAAALGLSVFGGGYPQSVWGYLQTHHPSEAIGYQGIAYVASGAYQLTDQAELQNHSFELSARLQYGGGIVDANPRDIVSDFLSNSNYGTGFPAASLGDLTDYSAYCIANGLFLSPALTDQRPAHEILAEWMDVTNTAAVWSEGVLKIIPYGDTQVSGNGVIYTPNVTPIYDLSDDDFLYDASNDPILITRTPNADAYNQVQIEFIDRANQYNTSVASASDQANIDLYGLRPQDPLKYHAINAAAVARTVSQLRLQRLLYIRNSYEFRLGWKYALLEPMDIVTLTDAGLGLDRYPVRITVIDEDESGNLAITAEDFPIGVAHAPLYPAQSAGGYAVDYNATAGNVNPPVVFEAPVPLTQDGLEVWIAASGGPSWGGCEVWVSADGDTYRQAGTIRTPARMGVLSAALPSGADPDTVNTLSVDITESRGELLSGTQADADSLFTACYVDGEIVSYQHATLTAQNKYSLSYLRRGAYGTPVRAHNPGTQFTRLDAALFRYPFAADMIGRPVYLKFLSYNSWGGGKQALPDVPAYTYAITGSALSSPLPDVQNLISNLSAGLTQMHWDGVADFRTPIDYEVRSGASWETAKMLWRTPLAHSPVAGDGTYWVAAHYRGPDGLNVYSGTPTGIVIAGATLVGNVVASYDERALAWPGVLSGGAAVRDGDIVLQGAGGVLPITDFLGLPDVLWYGGVAASGQYDLPSAHEVDIGRVAPCQVSISYTVQGQSIYDNTLTLQDVLAVTDFLSAALGLRISAQPQIAMAQADGVYGAWQNFVPGTYNARHFKARLLLGTCDPQVTVILSGMVFSVDVPDRTEEGNVQVVPGGMSVVYAPAFNGGVGSNPAPLPQITILNAQQGDDVILSAQTLSGFTVQIVNGGTGVIRNINFKSQGY